MSIPQIPWAKDVVVKEVSKFRILLSKGNSTVEVDAYGNVSPSEPSEGHLERLLNKDEYLTGSLQSYFSEFDDSDGFVTMVRMWLKAETPEKKYRRRGVKE